MTVNKLPTNEEHNYTFVNNLEEQVFDLVGKVQSDRLGGTTGHISFIMTPLEVALITIFR